MRVESLTIFRFFAAVIVVIFHYGQVATGFGGILAAGPQMVTFFFVLSGFVMTISYFHKDKINIKTYYRARAARIMPVYLLALCLVLIFQYFNNYEISLVAVGLNFTLLQAWVPPYPLTLNIPGWSLSIEMFLYFTFPFIVIFAKKNNISASRMIVASSGIWLFTQVVLSGALSSDLYQGSSSLLHDLIFYFPLSHFCSFLLGISGGMLFLGNRSLLENNYVSLAAVGGSALVTVGLLNYPIQIESYLGFRIAFGSSFLAPFFLLFILSLSLCHARVVEVLSLRPLVLLGDSSYSIYILQVPVYLFYVTYISPVAGLGSRYDFYAYLILLVTISILMFLYFERPATRYFRYNLPFLRNNS